MSSIIDSIRNTLGENLGGPAQALSTHQFSLDEVPDLSNKVAVVTGGSEGIGFGCTYTLLKKNIEKVFVLAPREEVMKGALEVFEKELGKDKAGRVEFVQTDLMDWKKTKEVAEEIKRRTKRLDILINNAGKGIMSYALADNGVDSHFALNVCGHIVLTSHLLPLLSSTSSDTNPVRIVLLSSNAHRSVPKDTSFSSLSELNQDLGANAQYGRSKLGDLLYARWLARNLATKNKNILVNASHPGVVSTKQSTQDIHEPFPIMGYGVSTVLEPFKKDQFEGCVSSMFAATVTMKSGEYICPPAVPEQGSELSNSIELQDQMMKFVTELVNEKTRADSSEKGCPFDLTKVKSG